jgi:nicotinamide phosphoribosyltransferase
MELSFIELCDGYKMDHRRQYPPGTELVFSNFTPRASRIPGQEAVVHFGLQYFLDYYLGTLAEQTFFSVNKDKILKEYADLCLEYLGPNDIGVDHIAAFHDLGYVPVEFRSRAEGSLVKLGTPSVTVHNTIHSEEYSWITNWMETLYSSVNWFPCTSATTSYRLRKLLDEIAVRQGTSLEFVPWQGHDFSFRGMTSPQSAIISGAAHLLSFTGTDTVPALRFLKRYYDGTGLIGGSVPATEHSVVCAGGKGNEYDTLGRLINVVYPSGIFSYVGDTWNIWDLLQITIPALKDDILDRDGKVVIRPDSGIPAKIIAGDPEAPVGSPEYKGVIELLWEVFGGEVTSTGYKILDSHVGIIYGDGVNEQVIRQTEELASAKGFSIGQNVWGVGSFQFQYVTRDTYNWAIKATGFVINGQSVEAFKDPITDTGNKKSAHGFLAVDKNGDLVENLSYEEWLYTPSLLEPVWRDGQFIKRHTLAEIRERLHGASS